MRVGDLLDLYNSTPTQRKRQLADALRKTGLLGTAVAATTITTEPTTTTSSSSNLTVHDNAYHSATYITALDVTYTNLNANGSVGNGAAQVAVGNHVHATGIALALVLASQGVCFNGT